MKLWKHTIITALAFFGVCSMVVYSSCDRDPCLTLKCSRNATCVNGFCQCPAGYEGTECETRAYDKIIGTYYGNTKCDFTPFTDTVVIEGYEVPNKVTVLQYSRGQEKFLGTIEGNEVVIRDDANGKYMNLVLDANKKLTLYTEDGVGGNKKECTFVGVISQ
jgi:hypothetical protein